MAHISDSLADLLAAIRAYCLANYPGEVPFDLSITFASGRLLCHAVPLAVLAVSRRAPTPRPVPETPQHTPDFRSVCWGGETYTFTTSQALIVAALWDAWEKHIPDVSGAALLEAAESQCDRLRDLFPRHPAWGTLVVPGDTRGTYRLQEPEPGEA